MYLIHYQENIFIVFNHKNIFKFCENLEFDYFTWIYTDEWCEEEVIFPKF